MDKRGAIECEGLMGNPCGILKCQTAKKVIECVKPEIIHCPVY